MTGRIVVIVLAFAMGAGPAIAASPPRVQAPIVAPGRIAFVDPATTAVHALPDGAILVAGHSRTGIAVARLRADGTFDPAFAAGGIARVALRGAPVVAQLLVASDGAIVVVAVDAGDSARPAVFVRLSPTGHVDAGFGDGGIARVAIGGAYDLAGPAALAADGSIVVAGSSGEYGRSMQPAVAKLTPAGILDGGFGSGGLVRLPAGPNHDFGAQNAVISPDGRIVVCSPRYVVGLTEAGAPDPGFNGGAPISLPGTQALLARPDGSIDTLIGGRRTTRIVRFTSSGVRDLAFGAGGAVALKTGARARGLRLLLGAGAVTTLIETAAPGDPPIGEHGARIDVHRVSADGLTRSHATLYPRFGGGATAYGLLLPVVQNAFAPEDVAERDDGSLIVAGTVSVMRHSEGGSHGPTLSAIAAFTPALAPDRTFGGPSRPALNVRVTRVQAAQVLARGVLALLLTSSAPGIVNLTLRDPRGHILSRRVAPLYHRGATRLSLFLPARARALVHHAGATRLSLAYDFRDVVAARVHATTAVPLR